MTLDGAAYRFNGNGEYRLLKSTNLAFDVQGRMVSCFQDSTCFNAIAVKVGNTVVMIHGRFTNDAEPSVFVDGQRVYTLEFKFGSSRRTRRSIDGFVLRRLSYLKFRLESEQGLRLDVRLYDRYLDIHIQFENKIFCEFSKGLWGNCNGNVTDDFNGEVPSDSFIHEVFGPSFKVPKGDSLFSYDFNQYQEPRELAGGGYAMFFDNTGAQTSELYSITSSDISIEFMVKLTEPSGTIISYTTTETFAVTVNSGTFYLHYADKSLDTLIKVQMSNWVQITIVWSRAINILQFYLNDAGVISSRNFPISSEVNVFEPGGVLALGYWRPSPTGRGQGPLQGFVGEIDELRIWNKKLDPQTVALHWQKNLHCRYSTDLASLWKFNEGQGMIAKDCISTAHITLPSFTWHSPRWVYSTAPVSLLSVTAKEAHSLRLEITSLPWSIAEKKCNETILESDLKQWYPNLDSSLLSFYYRSCVMTVTRTGTINNAYWILLAASDFGLYLNSSNHWYAKRSCNSVLPENFPEWIGPDCKTLCRYGKRDNKNTASCKCRHGFYGESCINECPGGFHFPCNGMSTCDSTSDSCECPLNANVSRDCATCEQGWTAKDCSLSISTILVKSITNTAYCQGYGTSHYTTFDGAGFDFGIAGEYYALNTASIAVHVRQIPCGNSSLCITSVAIKTTGNNVTIRAPFDSKRSQLVWINRVLTNATTARLDQDFTFRKVSPRTYEIANSNMSSKHTQVRVSIWGKQLSFEITAAKDVCQAATGLCSSCDGDVSNDFTGVNGTILSGGNATYSHIIHLLSTRWSVELSDSMFVYNIPPYYEKRDITATRYCLAFNGSMANSQQTNLSLDSDVVIQFFVKISKRGGTILSYATNATIGIVNDDTVKVYIGAEVYDTGLALQVSTWYQITVKYQRRTGRV